ARQIRKGPCRAARDVGRRRGSPAAQGCRSWRRATGRGRKTSTQNKSSDSNSGAELLLKRRNLLVLLQQIADLGEEFSFGGHCLRFGLKTGLAAFDELVHRNHNDEVDSSRDDHKGNERVEDCTDVEYSVVDRDGDRAEAWLTAKHRDEGVD